jgi:hypothetical protein
MPLKHGYKRRNVRRYRTACKRGPIDGCNRNESIGKKEPFLLNLHMFADTKDEASGP